MFCTSYSIPKDALAKHKWEQALNGQECSSSQWICIEHFTPDDFTTSTDGKKFRLKEGSIPTIFNVFLIEVSEFINATDLSSNNKELNDDNDLIIDANDVKEIRIQNMKLQKEVEEMKCKLESEKIITNARINNYKNNNKKYLKEIHHLKEQIGHLKTSIDELKKESDSPFGYLNVIFFILN